MGALGASWKILLGYRVSAVLVAAALAFGVVELVALLVLSKRAPWVTNTWQFYVVHPFTGDDARLSFTKIFAVFLATLYALGAGIPASVGVALIAASFGAKIFLALIDAWSGKTTAPAIDDTPPVAAAAPAAPAAAPAPDGHAG